MITTTYALVPRDGLFCKDGRGWSTSTSGRGHALDWPHPSTLLGALRSAWGRALEQRDRRAIRDWLGETASLQLGRTVALHRSWGAEWTPMWPVPADARILRVERVDRVEHLDPRPPSIRTIGRDADAHDAREQLWTACSDTRGKPQPRPRWWSHDAFVDWLVAPGGRPEPPSGATLLRRRQTHVSIGRATHTAIEGALFSHDVVETFDKAGEWAIGCEVELPELPEPLTITRGTLGSDRRLVNVESLSTSYFAVPERLPPAIGAAKGLRLITVTPVEFEGGWLPDGMIPVEVEGRREYHGHLPWLDCEVVLRAAFVERPLAVSGWDMQRGRPRPTSRMVPPGSVYSFVRADGRAFEPAHARAAWLAALGQRQHEGFGRVVPGVWNPQS